MKTKEINNIDALHRELGKSPHSYLLLYKDNSEQSKCALGSLKELEHEAGNIDEILISEVSSVRDIHPEYGIETVPSLLEFIGSDLVNVYKGCNGKDFYRSVFSGGKQPAGNSVKPEKRVTVYSTPTCSWCSTLKDYLRENNIRYTDIDVSADQKAAEVMVKKSGQQGVPQTDINGEIIIGFDKNRIDKLLEIGR